MLSIARLQGLFVLCCLFLFAWQRRQEPAAAVAAAHRKLDPLPQLPPMPQRAAVLQGSMLAIIHRFNAALDDDIACAMDATTCRGHKALRHGQQQQQQQQQQPPPQRWQQRLLSTRAIAHFNQMTSAARDALRSPLAGDEPAAFEQLRAELFCTIEELVTCMAAPAGVKTAGLRTSARGGSTRQEAALAAAKREAPLLVRPLRPMPYTLDGACAWPLRNATATGSEGTAGGLFSRAVARCVAARPYAELDAEWCTAKGWVRVGRLQLLRGGRALMLAHGGGKLNDGKHAWGGELGRWRLLPTSKAAPLSAAAGWNELGALVLRWERHDGEGGAGSCRGGRALCCGTHTLFAVEREGDPVWTSATLRLRRPSALQGDVHRASASAGDAATTVAAATARSLVPLAVLPPWLALPPPTPDAVQASAGWWQHPLGTGMHATTLPANSSSAAPVSVVRLRGISRGPFELRLEAMGTDAPLLLASVTRCEGGDGGRSGGCRRNGSSSVGGGGGDGDGGGCAMLRLSSPFADSDRAEGEELTALLAEERGSDFKYSFWAAGSGATRLHAKEGRAAAAFSRAPASKQRGHRQETVAAAGGSVAWAWEHGGEPFTLEVRLVLQRQLQQRRSSARCGGAVFELLLGSAVLGTLAVPVQPAGGACMDGALVSGVSVVGMLEQQHLTVTHEPAVRPLLRFPESSDSDDGGSGLVARVLAQDAWDVASSSLPPPQSERQHSAKRAAPLPPAVEEVTLFVGVLSSAVHWRRRAAVRASWMQHPAVRGGDVVVRFFVGHLGADDVAAAAVGHDGLGGDFGAETAAGENGTSSPAASFAHDVATALAAEQAAFGDLVLVRECAERYLNVACKVAALLAFGARRLAARWVMKADDDTYVRLGKLLPLLRGRDAWAREAADDDAAGGGRRDSETHRPKSGQQHTVFGAISGREEANAPWVLRGQSSRAIDAAQHSADLSGGGADAIAATAANFGDAEPSRDPHNKWFVPWSEFGGEAFPPFPHGAGYVMDVGIARLIAARREAGELHLFRLEDVAVGLWLDALRREVETARAGGRKKPYLPPNFDVRFEPKDFPTGGCSDAGFIAHYQQPQQLLCLWLQESEEAFQCRPCAAVPNARQMAVLEGWLHAGGGGRSGSTGSTGADGSGQPLLARLRRYFEACGARDHALHQSEVRAVRDAIDVRFGRGAARAYSMAARLRYCTASGRRWKRARHVEGKKRRHRMKKSRLRKHKQKVAHSAMAQLLSRFEPPTQEAAVQDGSSSGQPLSLSHEL